MMDEKRLRQQLRSVQRAIKKIEVGAQEAHIESNGSSRRSRQADLETLYNRERDLIIRLNRMSGRGSSRSIA